MSDEITNMSEQDRILGLRRDLQALLDKYQPTIRADKGYYDDIDAIEFTIGDKIAATYSCLGDYWDFS